MNAKTIASYIATAALVAALWIVGKALYAGGVDAVGAQTFCLIAIACSVWAPPAPSKK